MPFSKNWWHRGSVASVWGTDYDFGVLNPGERHKLSFLNFAHHGQSFLGVSQVVADASCRQEVRKARHLVDDLTLGHHDEEDRNQRKTGKGADDVESIFGRGVITLPGNGAGQSVRLRDVLAPAEQREAGPHGSH